MAKMQLLFLVMALLLILMVVTGFSNNSNTILAEEIGENIEDEISEEANRNETTRNKTSGTETSENEVSEDETNENSRTLDPYHGDSYRFWAQELLNKGKNVTKEAVMERFKELQDMKQKDLELRNERIRNKRQKEGIEFDELSNKPSLKVFVSGSMPRNLLKSYHKQVVKYGGTLVLNGLPNGSFIELARIVTRISEDEGLGSIQIDDEAFKRFGVTKVPAILLIREEDCFDAKYCKVTYDKVTGSIGIKPALEKFADNGELAQEAAMLLSNDNNYEDNR